MWYLTPVTNAEEPLPREVLAHAEMQGIEVR